MTLDDHTVRVDAEVDVTGDQAVLTQIVTDDEPCIEMAQLPSVLDRIESAVGDLPLPQRDYIVKSLLDAAVSEAKKRRDAG